MKLVFAKGAIATVENAEVERTPDGIDIVPCFNSDMRFISK